MKIREFFSRLDFFGQGILLSIIILPIAIWIITAGSISNYMLVSMLGLFFLGCWQLGSALLTAIFLKSTWRGLYLLAGVVYCSVLYFISSYGLLSGKFGEFFYQLLLFILPLFPSIWYFYQTFLTIGLLALDARR